MAAKTSTRTKEATPGFDFRTIKSFENACKKENVDPEKLPDVSMIPEIDRKALISTYKLFVIFRAINNGWIANFKNWDQVKYYPWLSVQSSSSRFDYAHSDFDFTITHSPVGLRLCTNSSEKAIYIAKTFSEEYENLITNEK